MIVQWLNKRAELDLTELLGWFFFHNATILLSFWAGMSFGKRIDDESRREIIRAIKENGFHQGSKTIGKGGETGGSQEA